METEDRVYQILIFELGRCLNGVIVTMFMCKQKGKREKNGTTKNVLNIFLVQKVRQIGANLKKTKQLSFKPVSPGVEAEGTGKNRLLSARSFL